MLRSSAFLAVLFWAATSSHAGEPKDAASTQDATPPPAAAPRSPLRPIVRAGDTLYLSGQAGYLPGTTTLADGGFEGEVRAALENVRLRLQTENATLSDVVQCTVYLKDIANFDVMNKVYRTFFPQNPPARTTLQVVALPKPEMNLEISCIAVQRVESQNDPGER